jgi:hypothetical protein
MGSMPNLRQVIFRFKSGNPINRLRLVAHFYGHLNVRTAELWINLSMRPIRRDIILPWWC